MELVCGCTRESRCMAHLDWLERNREGILQGTAGQPPHLLCKHGPCCHQHISENIVENRKYGNFSHSKSQEDVFLILDGQIDNLIQEQPTLEMVSAGSATQATSSLNKSFNITLIRLS